MSISTFSEMLLKCLSVACLATFIPGFSFAQVDVPVSQLLFEPQPIPAADTQSDDSGFQSAARGPSGKTELSPAERRELNATITDYIARIGDKEAAEGPYGALLTEDLFTVGQHYQTLGEHKDALVFFNRALNISRINHGLESIDQVKILDAMVDDHYALGELPKADNLQESMLALQQKAYGVDSVRMVPALETYADWNQKAFLERSTVLLNIPHRLTGEATTTFVQTGPDFNDLQMRVVSNPTMAIQDNSQSPLNNLLIAETNYLKSIELMLNAKDYTNPKLLELERKLVTNLFLRAHQVSIVYEPDFYVNRTNISARSPSYEPGRASLERTRYILNNTNGTVEQQALANLALADWDLLFASRKTALEKYEATYAMFKEYSPMTASLQDLLYPQVPVVLPIFLPAANSREKLGIPADKDVNYFGYFDVSFSLAENGKVRELKFLGQGGDVTKGMKRRLNRYLTHLVFRPRYTDEAKLDTEPMMLRYYVGY